MKNCEHCETPHEDDEICCDGAELDQAREALKVSQQFMLEVSHAMECGPGWYTRGEDGLRQQIYLWINKMRDALKNIDLDSYADSG